MRGVGKNVSAKDNLTMSSVLISGYLHSWKLVSLTLCFMFFNWDLIRAVSTDRWEKCPTFLSQRNEKRDKRQKREETSRAGSRFVLHVLQSQKLFRYSQITQTGLCRAKKECCRKFSLCLFLSPTLSFPFFEYMGLQQAGVQYGEEEWLIFLWV